MITLATSPWWALVRAHAASGSRAALRSGAIGVAMVIFAFGMAPNPAYTLMAFVTGIVAPRWSGGWSDFPQPRLLLALLALGFAQVGARRVTAGATGWLASLPVARETARRAAWAAATLGALPVAVFLVLACLATPPLYRVALRPGAIVTLPFVLAAAGAAAIAVRNRAARVLPLVALAAAARPDVTGAALALVLLLAWDRVAGGLVPTIARRRASSGASSAAPTRAHAAHAAHGARAAHDARAATRRSGGVLAASLLVLRWTWRAAGARAMADALAVATILVGFATLALRNNDDLAPATIGVVARLGAALGVVAAVAVAAGALLARRAPWPWPRSLPWSARRRVTIDAVAVAVPGIVVALVALPLLGAVTLPASLGAIAVAAPAASGALRTGAGRQTGAAGEPALLGLVAASLLAWFPWLALVAVAAGVALHVRAARRERGHEGAVRWNELRHDLGSDMGWISRT